MSQTVKVSNCGIDENGKASGGAAGDQTGKEWCIKSLSSTGSWSYVLRYMGAKKAKVRSKIATLGKQAASNDDIGYDQGQRGTYWTQLKAAGYLPKDIQDSCEADCSSGVAANVKAVGYLLDVAKLQGLSTSMTTANERAALKAVGFEELTYESGMTLMAGDILWRSGHTATVVSVSGTGSSSSTTSRSTSFTVGKTYTTKVDALNVRKGPGTSYAKLSKSELTSDGRKNSNSKGQLNKGTKVTCKAVVEKANGAVWLETPSGYICAVTAAGKVYVG